MNKTINKISLLVLGALAVTTCATSFAVSSRGERMEAASAQYSPGTTYTNHDAATYYSNITDSMEGTELLSALRSINSSRRKKTVGYGSMGTGTGSSAYIYTDYDPSTVKYDSKGQPYGTKVLSFYSGNSTTGWNREHVWPNSHGGNLVEADIHMPRPTIPAENGSRGNSFYVEGKCDGSKGWDPKMESFGVESYRGDSARIIFYCVVASSSLSLVDTDYHSTSNSNKDNLMGKLSDMLKWNLQYPVLEREMNRNEGAEYLQGNRNPFIDHPEYACKIWGNYNDATKAVCSGAVYNKVTLDKTSATLNVGESTTLTATASDGSTNFTWVSSDTSVATVASGKVTALKAGSTTITVSATIEGQTLTATCAVTVKDKDTPVPPVPPTDKGTLANPYTPSEARSTSFTGQAYVKGEAQNIKVDNDKVTLTLFDIGNMTSETGINVYNMELEGKTINAGDIVIVKATKSTANASLVAPGFIYSVERAQAPGNAGGCGGSAVTTSIFLFSSALAGFSLVVARKKKKEDNVNN